MTQAQHPFKSVEEVYAFTQSLLQDAKQTTELTLKLTALSDVAEEEQHEAYKELLQFIGSSTSLSSVTLDGSYMEAPAATISLFLTAIAKNSTITKLAIKLCKTSVEQFSHLLSTGNIENLEVKWCLWEKDANNNLRAEEILADAFRKNKTLKSLKLDKIGHKYVTGVVAALGDHTKLQKLSVHAEGAITPTNSSPSTIQESIRSLTRKSKSLKYLELNSFRLQYEVFSPISEGLLQSKSVTHLSFHLCSFFKGTSVPFTHLLNFSNVLGEETEKPDKKSTGCVLANLLRNSSMITTLDLKGTNYNLCSEDLSLVLGAIEQSTTLQCFHYGCIRDPPLCEDLLKSLPKMLHLKKMKLEFGPTVEPLKEKLLAAFRGNNSLQEIEVKAEFLDAADEVQMKNYTERNVNVPKLLRTASSDRNTDRSSLLPLVLDKALDTRETCNTTIFRGLLQLSGQELHNASNI